MEAIVEEVPGKPPTAVVGAAGLDLPCRVCELEIENNRLRLLLSELLMENQRLRETTEKCP